MTFTIKVTYDPHGMKGGKWGCYCGKIMEKPGVLGAGVTVDHAISEVVKTAASLGLSGDVDDYAINMDECPTRQERIRIDKETQAVAKAVRGLFRK